MRVDSGTVQAKWLCRFSCGAASAVATKLVLSERESSSVEILNVFVKEEHSDNRRFLEDCIKWFGHDITVLRDKKYGASTDVIWRRKRFMLPITYRMGYDNANCIGCPKGGQNYWQAIRHDFPERFAQVQQIQEEIGPGSYFLRYRSGPLKNQRMPLSELPEGRGNMAEEPSFSCSFFCEMAEDSIR